jgi:DNA polymerase-3 subunit alpha
MIVPFHNHSDASALDGASLPVEIVARAVQIDAPAVALTDHGVCTNHFELRKAAKKKGIKPIYGMEAYHAEKWDGFKGNERDQAHLILIAKNDIGLQNLWTLSYLGCQPEKFRFVPRLSWDDLEKHSEGIIATSACALGKVTQEMLQGSTKSLSHYLDIYGDDFYIGLSTYDCTKVFEDAGQTQADINIGLTDLGQERGIGFMYENDAHYAFPEQYEYHDAYVVSSTGRTKQGQADQSIYTPVEDRKMWHPKCLYIMDEAEVRERLNYLPDSVVDEAIQNSVDVAETIDAEFPNVERHLPIFVPKNCPFPEARVSDDAEELFTHLVLEGIKERYPAASQEVWDRALRETEVFLDADLHHYFLMAWDLNLFCDTEELPSEVGSWVPERTETILRGPGRGSAAGCIVAYALHITDVDPLRYGLIFERFWNAGRAKGFPDIDSDFARKWRGVILQYLKKRWGEDRVFPIGTTARMKPKACIDKLRSAYAMTFTEAAELKAIMDGVENIEILGPDSIAWSRTTDPDLLYDGKARTIYVDEHVGDKILEWIGNSEERARYVRACANLTNRIANYGIHPSGVLMLDRKAIGRMPFALRGPEDDRRVVTEFVMDEIDALMMIKLDVLGLKTLDTLDAWTKLVAKHGLELDWSGLDHYEYPVEMWEMLDKKFTAGVFQVEQGLARQFLAEFKCRSVEELAIAGSIIRPGPNKAMGSFLGRRRGEEDDQFDGRKIPILQPILEETYGWFLYQEQVIAFFSALGYDLSEADAVRKILGKKKPEDLEELLAGAGQWQIDVSSDRVVIQPVDSDGNHKGEPFVVTNRGYREVAYPQLGEERADQIWDVLEDFARYSFNKSHSVAYAVIGFRCLLAKYYAPAEFYAASIATVDDSKRSEHIPMYIAEARRLGITTHGPDILNSDSHVAVRDGDIYMGLSEVKGVKTGGDIVTMLRDEGYDLSTPESLFGILEEQAKKLSKDKAAAKKAGQLWDGPSQSWKQRLNSGKIQALIDAGAWDSLGYRDISMRDKQKMEKELIGVILTDDSPQILANHHDELEECDDYVEAEDGEQGLYTLPGVIINIRETKSRASQQKMGIITIEYKGDTLEFATSPKSWKSHRFMWRDRACGVFTIKKTERGYLFENGSTLT